VFSALVICNDLRLRAVTCVALAGAGCRDLELRESAQGEPSAVDVAIVHVTSDVAVLRALATITGPAPIIALCDDHLVDTCFEAGVADCATMPVRDRELAGRIRSALHEHAETTRRQQRERKLSDAIVALQREKQDLERLACVDSLTGVANRRHALALLEAEWRRSARDRASLGLVMIDLDCYHAYNEHYGHLGGDACLQQVTEAMVRCLRRPSDFLGRYGGEEFIAVLPCTDAVGAKLVAERLRAAVEALGMPHEASACARVITISAGFASFKVLGDLSLDKLIAAADAALLRAKAAGRNRIEGDAPLVRPTMRSAAEWLRFAPVVAEPWFADRIPGFLAETAEEARTIAGAIAEGALDRVRVSAQVLRASAAPFGFVRITELIAELEQACAGSREQAHAIADELLQYVTHVQVVYRRPVEAPIDASASAPTHTR
jgi:diguanylate cyclase (GGDEF)-like protein